MKHIIRMAIPILLIGGIAWYLKRQKGGEAKQEKVLYTVTNAQVPSFDPLRIRDNYSVNEAAKVYEGLLTYHHLKRPHELIPNLAESMPSVSDDQLVYTFTIRKGVKFHDDPCFPDGQGRELTAHDFVYSFKRLADPKLQSLNFWLLNGKLQGLNEWREKYADAQEVDYNETIPGLRALDRYTLQLSLTKPNPQLLHALAMAPCYVIPCESVQYYGEEIATHPVGTGPFMLKKFKPQDNKIVYEKNPTFRDKRFPSDASEAYQHMLADADKKLPLVDRVVTYVLPEEQPRWLKFQKGQLDWIDVSRDHVALELMNNASLKSKLQEKGVQFHTELEQGIRLAVFNNEHPLFRNNIKLRQAMSLAFDGAKFNELFYQGTAREAQSILPPGLPGYRSDYVNPYRCYNLTKAKQYLAAAGYPDGKGLPEIVLDVPASPAVRQQGEFFQQCMEKLGIRIKLVENIFPELIKKIYNKATMMHTISWVNEYPDAENFFQLLYGPNQPGGIGVNFHDPDFDRLYEQFVFTNHSAARVRLCEQMNQLAAEKVPLIYLVHQPATVLYQGWIKNYMFSDCVNGKEQYINIDLAQKEALLRKM